MTIGTTEIHGTLGSTGERIVADGTGTVDPTGVGRYDTHSIGFGNLSASCYSVLDADIPLPPLFWSFLVRHPRTCALEPTPWRRMILGLLLVVYRRIINPFVSGDG